ncbi:hemin-degrading factor [Leptospira wolffii]|uniref:hemin-degrading factor n=1 Tax=Leptospira wolffii TaxID=409998 RepID=UPI001083B73B|nr:ChuX/HutX family heme-like substrate-binding protein [Leptospira wolffii]TGK62611.1 hemin-degrading factor [Leptospira wolffii]TGK65586.1 hemin-degrading factor [Leptospira wolffii]TGK74002.1 hemin-degrading factor [Leptospira wolffii]TGL28863.1 hemin-degrading factor [Leptospira wolffii]
MSIAESLEVESVLKDWKHLRETQPRLRIRDIATKLQLSEAGLLAAAYVVKAGGFPQVRALKETWGELFSKLGELGHVMVLTRNEACVHERKGKFEEVSSGPGHILVVGPDIDLRLFPGGWKFGFSVEESKGDSVQRSFQFFDGNGDAVHKIFLTDKSDVSAWENLRNEFEKEGSDYSSLFQIKEKKEKPATSASGGISDKSEQEFLTEWGNLEDTHDFFGLLKKYNVSRIQSMKLAEGKFTRKLENRLVLRMLERASLDRIPIMVFVGNPGAIQIHTGEVTNIKVLETWWNILDPEFNLHLKSDLIAEAWIVDKPSKDGVIHSIEVYDEAGEMIVQFFGKRKPGQPERTDWAGLLNAITND